MADVSKSQNDGSDEEIVADEKQLTMIDADAEITDDDDISEIPCLCLSDGDSEVSDLDVSETQLNDAQEKFEGIVTAAPEKDYFSKVDKILRQVDFYLPKNVHQFQLSSMDYAYLAYRWCAVPIVATTNAMLISFLESLAAAGGFLALFFVVLISIYFAALPVIVFLISVNIIVFIAKDLPIVLWNWLVKTSAHASNRIVRRNHRSSQNYSYL